MFAHSSLVLRAVSVCALAITAQLLVGPLSDASAQVDVFFNVPNGDYNDNVASWVDAGMLPIVSPTLTNDNPVVANGGTVNITTSASGNILKLNDGTVEHSADTLTAAGIEINPSLGETGTYNLAAGATLKVNNGSLQMGDGDGTAMMTTSGKVDVGGEIVVGVSGMGTSTLNIDSDDVTSGSFIKIGFDSSGTINQSGGTLTGDWIDIGGQPVLGAGSGTYNISGGSFATNGVFRVGHSNGGSGTVMQSGGAIVTANNALRVGQYHGGTGSFDLSDGTLNVGGTTIVGGAENAGSAAFPSDGMGTLNISGGTFNATGIGSLRVGEQGTGMVNQSGGTVNLGMGGGNLTLASDSGTGEYTLSDGILNLNGSRIEPNAGAFNFNGGTLQDVGVYAGTLTQSGGILAPGASPGTMVIEDDYNLEQGTYHVEIDDGTHDVINVGGNVNLDADGDNAGTTLVLELLNGFSPTADFSIMVMNSGTDVGEMISGEFADFDEIMAPLGAGLGWEVMYAPTSVIVSVVSDGISGDFNNDGILDAKDYTIWLDNFGGPEDAIFNNGDGSGTVDLGDYNLWKTDFAPGVAVVRGTPMFIPEPASAMLLIAGFA